MNPVAVPIDVECDNFRYAHESIPEGHAYIDTNRLPRQANHNNHGEDP